MKEKQEENNSNDEDNEKLNPMKFESFNISLPENELKIPENKKTRLTYLFHTR